jgi:hypothetical protein
MNQQNVYPQLISTLKTKDHNCFIIIILYTPRCRKALRLDNLNIFNQIIEERMRLYRDDQICSETLRKTNQIHFQRYLVSIWCSASLVPLPWPWPWP